MIIAGSLNEPGTVTISGQPAIVDANNNFRGTVPTTSGTNTFTIVAKDATGNTTTHQYEVELSGASRTFTHDANGNLTGDGDRAFEWYANNRLATVNAGNDLEELKFDGLSQLAGRTKKTGGVVTATIDYVRCDNQSCEDRASGTTLAKYYRDGQIGGSNPQFQLRDHLSSVRAVTDTNADVMTRYEYDPWGSRTVSYGTTSTEIGFTGHRWNDVASGWFAEHRVYDSRIGRWLSEDPAGFVDGPLLFAYVRNQPMTLNDPSGLCSCGSECPSGNWQMDTLSYSIGQPFLAFSAGIARLRCEGRPGVARLAKIFCSPYGAHLSMGLSASGQFRGAVRTGICRRSDLQEFRTNDVILENPYLGTDGNSFSSGIGLSVGLARSPCRIVPM